MKPKRLICAAVSVCLCLSLASCGGKAPYDPPTPASTTGADPAEESTTETVASSEQATAEALSTEAETTEETTEEAAEVRLEDGLNSTDVAEVMAFYKLAAAKNDTPKYKKTLTLVSINGGEGKVADYVHIFEPIAKKAVANNTTTGDVMPGKYSEIRPEDWQSAEAVSDGSYTTIRVRVVPQTDGPNGKSGEGPVGRSMTVLDGVQTAVDEMPGVSADFENGDMEISYVDPRITVKIDNRTGAFVEGACSWSYSVHTTLRYLEAKVLAWTVHLINAGGVVDYAVTY
jgi:hypothetical protein